MLYLLNQNLILLALEWAAAVASSNGCDAGVRHHTCLTSALYDVSGQVRK